MQLGGKMTAVCLWQPRCLRGKRSLLGIYQCVSALYHRNTLYYCVHYCNKVYNCILLCYHWCCKQGRMAPRGLITSTNTKIFKKETDKILVIRGVVLSKLSAVRWGARVTFHCLRIKLIDLIWIDHLSDWKEHITRRTKNKWGEKEMRRRSGDK